MRILRNTVALAVLATLLAGCGSLSSINPFGGRSASPQAAATVQATRVRGGETVAVNRYIWNAALEVLNFLPIQSVDPFTGVITTGFGTPPGGGTAYRATVLVNDPALEARSLTLSIATRRGPAAAATVQAVENAILTRARQLRLADSRR